MSVKTSYALTEGGHYSVFLNKFFGLSFADLIVLYILSDAGLRFLIKPSIQPRISFLKPLLPLILFSMLSGFMYNIFVDFYPKPFLYDFKWFFYILAGTILPSTFKEGSRARNLGWVLFLLLICSLIDILYVQYFDCCHELPSLLDLPPLPNIISTYILILGAQAFSLAISFTIIAMQLLNSVNTLGLTDIYFAFIAVGIIILEKLRVSRVFHLLFFNFCYLVIPLFMITNSSFLSDIKGDGVFTRSVQIQNLQMNLVDKGWGMFGMGYGTTYREYIPTPEGDITAVGKSITGAQESSMSSPVKFIFNTPAAGTIYKYGAFGLIWLFFIMLKIHKVYKLDGWRLALLYLLYLVLLYPGLLKASFIATYLLALHIDKSNSNANIAKNQT